MKYEHTFHEVVAYYCQKIEEYKVKSAASRHFRQDPVLVVDVLLELVDLSRSWENSETKWS